LWSVLLEGWMGRFGLFYLREPYRGRGLGGGRGGSGFFFRWLSGEVSHSEVTALGGLWRAVGRSPGKKGSFAGGEKKKKKTGDVLFSGGWVRLSSWSQTLPGGGSR